MPGVSTMHQALLEDRGGHGDLDPLDALLVVAGCRPRSPTSSRSVEWRSFSATALPSTWRRIVAARLVAEAHERDGGGGEVVVDRADLAGRAAR